MIQLAFDRLCHDALPHAQDFAAWRDTPGGRAILERCFRRSAYYAARWRRHKIPVSIKLIWEQVRDELRAARLWQKSRQWRGIILDTRNGYALPNDLHPYVARFIVERRPDWKGMFETRELGQRRPSKRITVETFG
jgi:hypothetical protein